MDRFLWYGKRMWFTCRLLLGIEERNLRAMNAELQKRYNELQERKAVAAKRPESMILSEVRKAVEEMQRLNESLDNAEQRIKEFFVPLRKEAHMLIDAQLEKEKMLMQDMMQMMQSTTRVSASQKAALNPPKVASDASMTGETAQKINEENVSTNGDLPSHNEAAKVQQQKQE